MTRYVGFMLPLLLGAATLANAAPPRVVMTSPDNGEIDVDPAVKEIRIEFDQPMDARGRSIVQTSGSPIWKAITIITVVPGTGGQVLLCRYPA